MRPVVLIRSGIRLMDRDLCEGDGPSLFIADIDTYGAGKITESGAPGSEFAGEIDDDAVVERGSASGGEEDPDAEDLVLAQ